MTATYCQKGETLDYKNDTDKTIQVNTIIGIGSRIGIAGMNIEPKTVGSLHVCGVFEIAKKDGEEIEQGESVFFDGDVITKEGAGNTPAGYAAEKSGDKEKTVKVKLMG